jgi:hypothetical protein
MRILAVAGETSAVPWKVFGWVPGGGGIGGLGSGGVESVPMSALDDFDMWCEQRDSRTNVINVQNINEVHYAYKTVAATAVPAKVFSGGEPVAHNVVKVPPEQLSKAPITPHPNVRPTMAAAMPGKPIAAPPVRPATLVSSLGPVTHAGRAPTAGSRPASLSGSAPANRAAERAPAPEANLRAPSESRGATAPPVTTSPPHLVTRSSPPVARVPFADEHEAMLNHPGRPLEPQQLENLRRGIAPGPMVDREFPPHVGGIPRARAGTHSR